ncbi:MAG: hypothetical protein M0Q46_04135 [Endomicrobiales bacterium]|nr:hypothetical protein [Endomicrobiales bacterium]
MKNILALLIVALFSQCLYAGLKVDYEAGLVQSGYNDVQIPGNTGTRFSLSTQDLSIKSDFFWRTTIIDEISPKSSFELLIAPLTLKTEGTLKTPITFTDKTFATGSQINGTYRFDSYRLRYLYLVQESKKVKTWLGLTAKIRDASIKLSDGATITEKQNTGLVPLIAFKVQWDAFDNDFSVLCQGDALAAPQGRAEDVLVALQYKYDATLAFKLGYRVLEGGADNDVVYNFALLHYIALGATFSF